MLAIVLQAIYEPVCFENVRLTISRPLSYIELMLTPVSGFDREKCMHNVRLRLPSGEIQGSIPIKNYLHYYFAEFDDRYLDLPSVYEIWYGNYTVETINGEVIDNELIEMFEIEMFSYPRCFSSPELVFIGTGFKVGFDLLPCALLQNTSLGATLQFEIDEYLTQELDLEQYVYNAEKHTLELLFILDKETTDALLFIFISPRRTFIKLFDPENPTLAVSFEVFRRRSGQGANENVRPVENVSIMNGYVFMEFKEDIQLEFEGYLDWWSAFIFHFSTREWPTYITSALAAEMSSNNMSFAFYGKELECTGLYLPLITLELPRMLVFQLKTDMQYHESAINVVTFEHILYMNNNVRIWQYADSFYRKFDDNKIEMLVHGSSVCLKMDKVEEYYKTIFIFIESDLKLEIAFPRTTDECAAAPTREVIELIAHRDSLIIVQLRQTNGTFYSVVENVTAERFSNDIGIMIGLLGFYTVFLIISVILAFRKLSFQIFIIAKVSKAEKED